MRYLRLIHSRPYFSGLQVSGQKNMSVVDLPDSKPLITGANPKGYKVRNIPCSWSNQTIYKLAKYEMKPCFKALIITLGAVCRIKTQLPGDRVAGRQLLVAQLEASRPAQVVHQQRTRGPELPDAAGAVSQPEGPLHVRPANALQAAQDPLPSGEFEIYIYTCISKFILSFSRCTSELTSNIGLTHINQMMRGVYMFLKSTF